MPQDLPEDIDARRAVVIAADHHDLSLRHRFGQAGHKMIEQFHRFRGRNCPVIQISRDYDRVRLLPGGHLRDLIQDINLILRQIPVDKLQTDMKV